MTQANTRSRTEAAQVLARSYTRLPKCAANCAALLELLGDSATPEPACGSCQDSGCTERPGSYEACFSGGCDSRRGSFEDSGKQPEKEKGL